ncbi:hypothetical protein [Modestobacter sp. URMC 112]
MTDSPYAIPVDDLVAGARTDRSEQVEVHPVPEAGPRAWSPGPDPYLSGGGDADGD